MIKEVILFSAPKWCQPCKMFAPIYSNVSQMEEYKDITFSEVNIDEDENGLTEQYGIRSVPTLVILDEENNVLNKLIGAMPQSDFITALNNINE